MAERFAFGGEPATGLTRRAVLAGSLFGALRLAARADEPKDARSADSSAEIVARLRAEARKRGLSAFGTNETAHFVGIGDSAERWRKAALEVCEKLASVYVRHFREKGFTAVALPEARLTIVTLADRASYQKFLGERAGPDVGGHYDLDANCLVIYDFRAPANEPVANAARVNTFTLSHEGLHLLTYNTGLLDRSADVPLCVSEGLAAYGEAWRATVRTPFGQHNSLRRDVLAGQSDLSAVWVPVAKLLLLDEDKLGDDANSLQLFYAESWAFIHYLMKGAGMPKRFRAYLEAIRERRDASKRLDDAVQHLGDLDRLDSALRKHTRRLLEDRS